MKDQWNCVLNDLEKLGDKEFLVLTGQYNIEIFSCCHRLLPSCSSTFQQTTAGSSPNRSEDHLSVSRIQSLHLLLEVDDHDEEEYSVVLTLGNLLAQYQSTFFLRWVQFLQMSRLKYAFDRLAKASSFVFNANSSGFVSEVSCSLSSYSLSIKSVTNLFNPCEILAHDKL